MEENIRDFGEAYKNDDMVKEYLAFSQFMQNAFISEDGYIIDTGNFQTANLELIDLVYRKIKKHPIIWKLFFMVA